MTNKQHGASLIEILVAVFVVSIGLLGVARMEIFAKQANFEAIQRTTASQIAHDIMEKMRANPAQLANYAGQTVGDGTLGAPGADCTTGACSSVEVASWDIWEWEQLLIGSAEKAGANNTGGLDQSRGCITGPAGGSGEYVIAIAWRGNSPMPDLSPSPCGQGQGLYGTNDEYRRVLTMTVFVSDNGV